MTERFSLLAARLNAGLTQRELAGRCGVSLTTIQRLETPGHAATPRNAKRVADFFDVQVTDLLPLDEVRARQGASA